MDKDIMVQPDVLRRFIADLFRKGGMNGPDADFTADCLVKTNLWGVDSHGVLRVPVYLKRVISGAVNPTPEIKSLLPSSGPVALLDGDGGMGFVLGRAGMEKAIEQAKTFGIGMTLVRNSNHFGAAALYARLAVEAGLIGIASTNVIPNIGMKGNTKPSTGNNPIAVAAPMTGDHPFVLDISLSAVAGGKLLLAAKKGEKIPTNWAVTKEGDETDDPQKGFEGFLLPVGMHKGFGLSLFVDLVTGVLSGGPFLHDLKSMYKNPDETSLTTHLFMTINPSFFLVKQDYEERITEWARMIRNTPMNDPNIHQIVPGEIECKNEQERKVSGIPVPVTLSEELKALAHQLKISFPL
ncbi:hypothetical protein B4O97_15600 [Marispirochaeta aestuarii]|uniref:Lactate dehydrogenase n=1 Tax=Marispirochaeta aestuarii TaxID=1963862 RepID=A0A1Y1RVX5_9SPIO|nr:Ldh family oxidoreductase [Marispirochaeta aestuarii]ORC32720.1 hypothetical protein B4O97_15600 [Marispirochaeta aestuarii]